MLRDYDDVDSESEGSFYALLPLVECERKMG
jgi:hypothetical protein